MRCSRRTVASGMAISVSASALMEPSKSWTAWSTQSRIHAGRQQPVELRSELPEDRRPGVGHLPLLGVLVAVLGQVGAQRRHALRAGDRICAGGQGGIGQSWCRHRGRQACRSICVCEVVMTETIQSRLTSMPGKSRPGDRTRSAARAAQPGHQRRPGTGAGPCCAPMSLSSRDPTTPSATS